MLSRLYQQWLDSYRGIPRVIWFLSFINLVNRCGGMVISFITLYLTQRLHFSIQDAGYTMGFFGAGAMLGAYLGGRLADKVGYRSVMFWSLVSNGLILMALVLVRDFWPMCAAVFLMSVSSETFRPANSVAISQNSSPETRTRAISLYRMSANMGWTVAPALGGLLVMLGWEWLFWVDGLTCLAAALLLRWLPERPAQPVAPVAYAATAPAPPSANGSPFRDASFMWFVLLTMLNAVVFMQLLWTVPVFFKESYHWSEAQIGAMMAANGLVVFLVEMPLIYRIEGRRPAMEFVRVGLLLYLLAYLCFLAPVAAIVAATFYMVFISFGEIFVMPFSSNYVMGRAPADRQGQYLALYTMAYSLANIIAPLLGTQIIAAWGFPALWSMAAGLVVLVWVGLRTLEKRGHY